MDKYKVIDTPMRPKRYKVESTNWPGHNNSWTEYFELKEDADKEMNKRNNSKPCGA